MSNYVKSTNFYAKDALSSGNPDKIIKGAEIDDEYNNIATAVSTKADLNSPTFTGIPLAPTASAGTNTTQLATTAFVTTVVNTLGTISTQNANAVAITGGTITGLSSALPVASGGTGSTTSTGSGANVLATSPTLTSPTLTTPALGTPSSVVLTNATGTANALNAGIGVNQTYQSLTGSRAGGTTYTNSTGKPILVIVTPTGQAADIGAYVDGVWLCRSSNNNNFQNIPVSFIVPNGSSYYITVSAGSIGIWVELR